jgi:hypothetical protein
MRWKGFCVLLINGWDLCCKALNKKSMDAIGKGFGCYLIFTDVF